MYLRKFLKKILRKININNKMFICGIGGIGTSGLALLAKDCGYRVYGSNEVENSNTKSLKKIGIDVAIGHKAENLEKDTSIFVCTTAINLSSNVEAIEAKVKQIPMLNRGDMLSLLMKNYFNIVVAGSHGKTTTTGLIGHMLNGLNFKPNILLGGILNESSSNCQRNNSKYLIVESDESDGSFISMPANIAVITPIDPEHMNFYQSIENIEYYFLKFAQKAMKNNGIVVCVDSDICCNIVEKIGKNININNKLFTYSIQDSSADFYGDNIQYKKNGISFDMHDNIHNIVIKNVFVKNMYGKCNVSNTISCFAVGSILKQKSLQISKIFENFQGIQKRFTIIGKFNDTLVVDDYAHNPQKINAAIDSAKHYMKSNNLNGKLTVVFEPHRYTRINNSMELFSKVLSRADNIVILPIYASSEKKILGVNIEYISKECKKNNKNTFISTSKIEDIKEKLVKIGACNNKQNLIVFMGAGNSSTLAHKLVK